MITAIKCWFSSPSKTLKVSTPLTAPAEQSYSPRPFDIILFNGTSVVSKIIKNTEKLETSNTPTIPTHVGILLSSEVVDEPLFQPGKLYIFESTLSGWFGDKVPNIRGKTLWGVQARDFDAVIAEGCEASIVRLVQNPIDTTDIISLRENATAIYRELDGKHYEWSPFTLLGTVIPYLAKCGWVEDISDKRVFCSEMVTLFLKRLEILPSTTNERIILPIYYDKTIIMSGVANESIDAVRSVICEPEKLV